MLKRSLLLLVLSCFTSFVWAQKDEKEANLKAVFIYNFTRYVEWDSSAIRGNEFVIAVIGSSAVTTPLIEVARTNRVNGKRISIRRVDRPEDLPSCHILFIPKNIPYSLASILERTNKGTLTVSEETGFAKQGTAFNFVIVRDKLKFEANLKALLLAGLKVNSQLLKLATIVD
jgi:hypothetical protein